ncbi:gliding motility protein GldN [Rudanella paleaurantiibacter]|uniref:Gliding motility protein GldN n=1 Tax=Rudanella paleaurantiibacter TaxID=2614655 RepID=A0A7J5TWG3_9BACT|nr:MULTISPECIES: gliding motility protein GldN [Rudanella]KAB7728777.1 gliding motility protein GldN [Rudanella paleaurantiibacter]
MNQPKNMRFGVGAVAILLLAGGSAVAQEKASTGANPMSVRPINDNDIMMKKTLWRRIDLKEKQNQSMFSKNNEISKYLMEAVKSGLLVAYENDSTRTPMTPDKFQQKILMPNSGGGLSKEEIEAGFGQEGAANANDGWGAPAKKDAPKAAAKTTDDGWGAPAPKKKAEPVDDGWGAPAPKKKAVASSKKGAKGKATKPAPATVVAAAPVDTVKAAPAFQGDEYFARDLNILEIKEDWIFDRKRSRLYYDIQTVTLYLPADKNPAGLEVPVASFKYADLDKLFRSDPKKFVWYNPQNQAQHKNLADAFDLRLFYGRITKVSNPEDKDLVGVYGDREGLLKSIQTEHELMEMEHGLWEY